MASRTFLKFDRLWLIIAAGCVVLATLSSLAVFVNSRVTGRTSWNDVIFTASLWLVFGALTQIPYALSRRFPIRRERIGRTIAAHLAGAGDVSVLDICWCVAGFPAGSTPGPSTFPSLLSKFATYKSLLMCIFVFRSAWVHLCVFLLSRSARA